MTNLFTRLALIEKTVGSLLLLLVEYAYLTRQSSALAQQLHVHYNRVQAIHEAGIDRRTPCDPRDFFPSPGQIA